MKKHTNSIKQLREDSKFVPTYSDRKAVVVSTEYAKGKRQYGLQFWTDIDVKNGKVINTDNTIANFVDFL